MIKSLSETQFLTGGENASVFTLAPDRVLKLYRSGGPPGWQAGLPLLHAEEVRAYGIAMSDPVLSRHVARFFGREEVGSVTDADGADVSERYLLGLGIILEQLSGTEIKIEGRDGLAPHLVELLDLFEARGIYATDASVFQGGGSVDCKFIDITTHRGNELTCALVRENRASQQELEAWYRGE